MRRWLQPSQELLAEVPGDSSYWEISSNLPISALECWPTSASVGSSAGTAQEFSTGKGQEGALDADAREYCLQALAPLSAELDAEEVRAIRKALETGSKDKSTGTVSKTIQQDELLDCDLMNFLEG
ncbi:unnamed protein product, partial [Cladocopium goreaui]